MKATERQPRYRAMLGLGILGAILWSSAAQARWADDFFNPEPESGDLILPMPCDGAMVFRPVTVIDGGGPLQDREIPVGTSDTENGFNESAEHDFIAAPFDPEQNGKRLYYMGKYEVTNAQFAAVTGASCSTLSDDARVAKSNVSWGEAEQFAEKWTTWLMKNDKAGLPRRDKAPAFVRLPTEDEWEFAARGGSAVTETEFAAATFPMPEGTERYVIAGSRAVGNRVQPIGETLPNPLKLYDMLGNVAEWVEDAYRARHPDRADGMVGGLVARGGNYRDTPSELSTATRVEIPPYTADGDPTKIGEPTRLPTIGFRVVLGAPVGGGSTAVVQELRKAFATLPGHSTDTRTQELLTKMLQQNKDNADLHSKLDDLNQRLAADASARADAERAELKAQVDAAATIAYTVCRLSRSMKVQETALGKDYSSPADKADKELPNVLKGLKASFDANHADRVSLIDTYSQLVQRTAGNNSGADIKAAVNIVQKEYTERGDRRLATLTVVSGHLTATGAGQKSADPNKLLDALSAPCDIDLKAR